MSNFGSKLAELLELKKLSQAELSRLSGISEALISKWTNGQQKYVSIEDLAKLCGSISRSGKDQAELIRAHLFDEMDAPGSELIDIKIRGAMNFRETPPSYRSALPLNLQRALDTLGQEAVTDADVRAVILGLAQTIAKHQSDFVLHDAPPRDSVNSPPIAGEAGRRAMDHLKKKSGEHPK